MARSKRSSEREAYWRLVMKEQRRSGLNIRAFCQQKSLSEPSFYAWRKELRKRDGEKAGGSARSSRLIAVEVVNPKCDNAAPSGHDANRPLEIITPGGFALRFDHDTTPETISRLLGVIAGRRAGGATPC